MPSLARVNQLKTAAVSAATLLLLLILGTLPAAAYEPGEPVPGDLVMTLTGSASPVDPATSLTYSLNVTNPTVTVRVCDPTHKPNPCWNQAIGPAVQRGHRPADATQQRRLSVGHACAGQRLQLLVRCAGRDL